MFKTDERARLVSWHYDLINAPKSFEDYGECINLPKYNDYPDIVS